MVAAVVERYRRATAIRDRSAADGGVYMSAMWLVPQIFLAGLAEGFNFIGQVEFYYTELPKSMSTIAMSFFTLGAGFGNLLSSLVVNIVVRISSSGGKKSWVASDLKGHLDYYYWLLAAFGCLNFLYFLLCGWAYGPCKEELRAVEKGEQVDEEGSPTHE